MEADQRRMIALRDEIRKLDYHYYVLDNPLISDTEYDGLMWSCANWSRNTLWTYLRILLPSV